MQGMRKPDLSKFTQRLVAMRQGFVATKQADPKFLPLFIGVPIVVFGLVGGIFLALGMPIMAVVFALLFALLSMLLVFGRRATAAQINAIEGQPGAAAAVLNQMRGAWITTPGVAFTRKQDFVHRAVGPPGVVLIGEGSSARVTQMLKQEKRKLARVVGDVALHEVAVGNGEGQVPLRKLRNHIMKLPRSIKPKQVGPLNTKLSSVQQPDVPLPKGPLPFSRKQR